MHVLPRVWEAAHLFHEEGTEEAEQFVCERLLKVLRGGADGGRPAADGHQAGLGGFLENNLHRMRYDEYLAAGHPIATGGHRGRLLVLNATLNCVATER